MKKKEKAKEKSIEIPKKKKKKKEFLNKAHRQPQFGIRLYVDSRSPHDIDNQRYSAATAASGDTWTWRSI